MLPDTGFSRQDSNSLPWLSCDRDNTVLETPPPTDHTTMKDSCLDFDVLDFEDALSGSNDPPMGVWEEEMMMGGRTPPSDHGYTSSSGVPSSVSPPMDTLFIAQPPRHHVKAVVINAGGKLPIARGTYHKPSSVNHQEACRQNGEVYKQVAKQQLARKANKSIKVEEDSESARWTAHGDPNSHSARYARQYRAEKKQQVVVLQQEVNDLKRNELSLTRQLERKSSTIDDLTAEVEYLRAVIANESALAPIMQRVLNVPGTKLNADNHEDANKPRTRKRKAALSPAKRGNTTGVCVHLNGDRMSIEMCAKCAQMQERSVAVGGLD